MPFTLLAALTMLLPAAEPPLVSPELRQAAAQAAAVARDRATATAYVDALDAAYRADDWQLAAALAQEAQRIPSPGVALTGRCARALWRAGQVLEAERLLKDLPLSEADADVAAAVIHIFAAAGRLADAQAAAQRLRSLEQTTAKHYSALLHLPTISGQTAGVAELYRRTQKAVDPSRGYPDTLLADNVQGVAEFYDQVSPAPLNRVTRHGAANMPVLAMLGLPSVEVMINGRGPYRMVLDTGGSITLSIDTAVAEEIGLKPLAEAAVRGVMGKSASQQSIVDRLDIGGIRCERVMTRVFNVREAVVDAADGILGTGIFVDQRMILDFAAGKLRIEPSSTQPAAGRAVDVRFVSDAKLMALIQLNGQPAIALLDTGADAVVVSPSRMEALMPGRSQALNAPVAMGVGDGANVQLGLGPGVDFEFAGRSFKNYGGLSLEVMDSLLGPALGMQSDVLLGMAVFRDLRSMTVDYGAHRVWVEWLE